MATWHDEQWWETTPCEPEPIGPAELRAHLTGSHGMPAGVLDAHDPAEWALWHAAEHRYGHPSGGNGGRRTNALDHTHPSWVPKKKEKAA